MSGASERTTINLRRANLCGRYAKAPAGSRPTGLRGPVWSLSGLNGVRSKSHPGMRRKAAEGSGA
jgi:hypothetical protein